MPFKRKHISYLTQFALSSLITIACNLLVSGCFMESYWTSEKYDTLFGSGSPIDSRARFEDITLPDTPPKSYSVMILSDMHIGQERDADDFIAYLQEYVKAHEKPLFCANLGDLNGNGSHDQNATYLKVQKRIEDMGIPVYCVPGNHDTFDGGNHGEYYIQDISHTSFFRIKIHGTSYYFLDTADGTLGYKQFSTLKKEMRTDQNRKIMLTHYPLYCNNFTLELANTYERAQLMALYAEENVAYAICGHTHKYFEFDFGAFYEVIVSAICEAKGKRNFIILTVDEQTLTYLHHAQQF